MASISSSSTRSSIRTGSAIDRPSRNSKTSCFTLHLLSRLPTRAVEHTSAGTRVVGKGAKELCEKKERSCADRSLL